MNIRGALALIAVLIAVSLIFSPVTMSDWDEQASLYVERVEQSDRSQIPSLSYDNLSKPAQNAVRGAIESPNGQHTIFGTEDWPDRFVYSDAVTAGEGLYTVAYDGNYYRLTTYVGGGFPFVYWLFELPFIGYGFLLGAVAYGTLLGRTTLRTASLATVPGIGFHLLGPEFDFPLLGPMGFITLGMATLIVVTVLIVVSGRRENEPE